MSKKQNKNAAKNRQAEEDKLLKAITDHPYKPSKMKDLAQFYLDNSLSATGEEAKKCKRQAYDTFVQCIAKYDELKFKKDNNGAPIKLDKKEINAKCSLLPRLAIMSKDMDIMSTPSMSEEND